MVKHIYAEDSIKIFIENLVKKKKTKYGVIIGRMTASKYFATKLIPVPDQDENSLNHFQMDDTWLAGSAAEVANMLPGGICVVGIFAFAPSDNKMLQNLRQALYVMHKILSKSKPDLLTGSKGDNDPLAYWSTVQFEISTGKPIICTQYDIRNHASSSRPADWRYQKSNTRWGLLKTNLEIDQTLYLNQLSSNIKKQLKDTIDSYCVEVSKAIVEVDGSILPSDKQFFSGSHPPNEASVRNGKKGSPKSIASFECSVFFPNSDEESSSDMIEPSSHQYVARVKGSVYACAYLTSDATAQDAIQELKADAISSLHHRCKLAAEDLQDAEKTLSENTVIVLPKRVGFSEPAEEDGFMYFDYTFEEELPEDCTKRIKEQFDMDILPENLITDLEDFPSISDIAEIAEATYDDNTDQVGHDKEESRCFQLNLDSRRINIPLVLTVGAIIVVILGICLLRM